MKLTENFSLKEFTFSPTAIKNGIKNDPSELVIKNLKSVCENVLQPLRDYLGEPIEITSGYRAINLNKIIGGAKSSQHLHGQAVDFKCNDMAKAFKYITENLEYDQIIWEFGDLNEPDWIHVSYVNGSNRKNRLRAYRDGWQTAYKKI